MPTDTIATEANKLDALTEKARQAESALAEAKQQLVDAKVNGRPESAQKPLLKAVIEATVEADAARAAAQQQAETLDSVRREIEERKHQASLDEQSEIMSQARTAYSQAFSDFEPHLREAPGAFDEMPENLDRVLARTDPGSTRRGPPLAGRTSTVAWRRAHRERWPHTHPSSFHRPPRGC